MKAIYTWMNMLRGTSRYLMLSGIKCIPGRKSDTRPYCSEDNWNPVLQTFIILHANVFNGKHSNFDSQKNQFDSRYESI